MVGGGTATQSAGYRAVGRGEAAFCRGHLLTAGRQRNKISVGGLALCLRYTGDGRRRMLALPVSERQSLSRPSLLSICGDMWCREVGRDATSTRDLRLPLAGAIAADGARAGRGSRGARVFRSGSGKQDDLGRFALGGTQGPSGAPWPLAVSDRLHAPINGVVDASRDRVSSPHCRSDTGRRIGPPWRGS